ncbi:hypothetical protein BFO01nite_15850 [Brevibacillus formosus]|uniref:Uncharacterized protein n=1 Tax=Brevibacillus formosus TaxID=54913 RepID=A0ABQ0T257_9BACL|nr:hypothetical protein BFO01nite_15850 [Brevibacillus formosus]
MKRSRTQFLREKGKNGDDDAKTEHDEKSNKEQEGKVLLIHYKSTSFRTKICSSELFAFSTLREGKGEVKPATWAVIARRAIIEKK